MAKKSTFSRKDIVIIYFEGNEIGSFSNQENVIYGSLALRTKNRKFIEN